MRSFFCTKIQSWFQISVATLAAWQVVAIKTAKFWLKITRLHHATAAALATWLAALLSDGDSWISTVKLAGPVCMFWGVIGASLFHFGAAHKMYARKACDHIQIENPRTLVICGLVAFGLSNLIAWIWLPSSGRLIAGFNTIAIVLYARVFARHFATKNLLIALVCTTPVLLGWSVGSHIYDPVPLAITAIFLSQLAREIYKDVMDIRANHGIRVTLPMALGKTGADLLAGFFSAASAFCLVALCVLYLPEPNLINAPLYLSAVLALVAAFGRPILEEHIPQHLLTGSNWLMLVTFFGVRLGL